MTDPIYGSLRSQGSNTTDNQKSDFTRIIFSSYSPPHTSPQERNSIRIIVAAQGLKNLMVPEKKKYLQ
jgi:hypothetical protein